jgi:hypothetical protein
MGQYYTAILLDKEKEKIIGNILPYDYGSGAKLMEHSWMNNSFVQSVESMIYQNPMPVVWAGDYADPEEGINENLYSLTEEITNLRPSTPLTKDKSRYIINHDAKEYVDKTKCIDQDGWVIHPLPLLTAEGNGRGGGDFRGESSLVGIWSRENISVTEIKPSKEYDELIFDLKEETF